MKPLRRISWQLGDSATGLHHTGYGRASNHEPYTMDDVHWLNRAFRDRGLEFFLEEYHEDAGDFVRVIP